MTAPYEVTYKNMLPSDAVNACVRTGVRNLHELAVPAPTCHAWLERGVSDSSLTVRIEVTAGETRLEARVVSLPFYRQGSRRK